MGFEEIFDLTMRVFCFFAQNIITLGALRGNATQPLYLVVFIAFLKSIYDVQTIHIRDLST